MEEKQGLPPSRNYLESLTSFDLAKLADNAGIDIPPALDRIFIIEELLDYYAAEDEDAIPEPDLIDSVLVESVHLPKQYNITFIEVIIRDPLWAFVFWELKGQDKEYFEKDENFAGYYLKVSPLDSNPALKTVNVDKEGVFSVPVGIDDTAWYLNFIPEPQKKSRFIVELCTSVKGQENILAASKPISLPALQELSSDAEMTNPLINLSGYDEFEVIRRNERSHRMKRSPS